MQYFYSEGQFKVARNPVTGTKCRTGQLNHKFVEQQLINDVWTDIGGNDAIAGEGCRFREGARDGDYVVDVELEVAGFLLAQDDGWENIGGAVGYWNPERMPSGLTLSLVPGGVKIDFTDNTGGTKKHQIWGKVDSGDYVIIGTINAGLTTLKDFRFAEDLMTYKVRGKSGKSYSDFSVEASITMLGAEMIPSTWNNVSLATFWNAEVGANWSGNGTKLISNGSSGNLVNWGFWNSTKTFRTIITVLTNSGRLESMFDGNITNYYNYTDTGRHINYYKPEATVGLYIMSTLWDGEITEMSVKEVLSPDDSVLVLGNSITKHGINSYWWGFWGMAASVKDNDFVHRLMAKMIVGNSDIVVHGENMAVWEADHGSIVVHEATIKPFSSWLPKTVIIRLGENVTDLTNFDVDLQFFIDWVHINFKYCTRIIITGVFWTDAAKDAILSAVASTNSITFISLSQLDLPENKGNLGNIVYDAYGDQHLIDYSAVADHPGDAGMEAIASAIFAAI